MLNLNDQLFNKPIHRKNIISIELVEDFEVVYSFRKLHYYIMAWNKFQVMRNVHNIL